MNATFYREVYNSIKRDASYRSIRLDNRVDNVYFRLEKKNTQVQKEENRAISKSDIKGLLDTFLSFFQ